MREELKWFQRSKEKDILDGHDNTKYYHLRANGRIRKTRIFSLQQEEGSIEGDTQLLAYITSFYKQRFGNWHDLCTSKEQGGLGVLDLNAMNVSLLCKWLWKLQQGDGV